MPLSLDTYLTFDGNCREAFEFYRSVFGGEFDSIGTFGEAPPLSANLTETPAPLGITVGRWR